MATAEALASDEAAERLDRDRDDWGKTVAIRADSACRWIRDTYRAPLNCRTRPEWE